jgi:hypothetical protein
MSNILVLLLLLQIKHWYIDFVNQSSQELEAKKLYGNFNGIKHSLKHGLGTMLCLLIITGVPFIIYCIILGFIDFAMHYHIDYAKTKYKDLGLDQLLHQLTYILIAFLMT